MGYITHISTSVSKLEESHFKLGVDKQIELHYSEQNFNQHEIAYHFHILLKILVS